MATLTHDFDMWSKTLKVVFPFLLYLSQIYFSYREINLGQVVEQEGEFPSFFMHAFTDLLNSRSV